MNKPHATTIKTKVPDALLTQAQDLIDAGWFLSLDEIVLDALRHYLESRRLGLMENFIREDVEWGRTGVE